MNLSEFWICILLFSLMICLISFWTPSGFESIALSFVLSTFLFFFVPSILISIPFLRTNLQTLHNSRMLIYCVPSTSDETSATVLLPPVRSSGTLLTRLFTLSVLFTSSSLEELMFLFSNAALMDANKCKTTPTVIHHRAWSLRCSFEIVRKWWVPRRALLQRSWP